MIDPVMKESRPMSEIALTANESAITFDATQWCDTWNAIKGTSEANSTPMCHVDNRSDKRAIHTSKSQLMIHLSSVGRHSLLMRPLGTSTSLSSSFFFFFSISFLSSDNSLSDNLLVITIL